MGWSYCQRTPDYRRPFDHCGVLEIVRVGHRAMSDRVRIEDDIVFICVLKAQQPDARPSMGRSVLPAWSEEVYRHGVDVLCAVLPER